MSDDTPSCPGIYVIRNTVNGKCYVGQAGNIALRWRQHQCVLVRGAHHNPLLQNAYDKYGADAFVYEVIERVSDVALLDAREQHYMDTLTPAYNVRLTAMSNRGIKRTEEVRAKLREARKLHPMPFTSETRAKIGAAHKGSKRTAETRARMSASAFKAMASPEVREKIAASKRGKKRPPHVIEAIRKATKGRKLTEDQLAQRREYAKAHNAAAPLLEAKARETEEQRVARLKKIADAHRGRKRPPEVGAKISAAKMGHTVSAVTRQKISESQRKNPRTVRPETREKYRQAALKRWHGQKLPDEG